MRCVLTIAGFDPCGGAGLQADLKTISALGAYALTAVTAITAQNTRKIRRVQYIEPQILEAQLAELEADLPVDAVKIGMLGNEKIVHSVISFLQRVGEKSPRLPVVLDPLMESSSGCTLLEREAREGLIAGLFPLATVLTPNIPEAEIILGRIIKSQKDMEKACLELTRLGPAWVVLKGGHHEGNPVDILGHDGEIRVYPGEKIPGSGYHGTGCTFASALAVFLARGVPVPEAVAEAKRYVEGAIKSACILGQGAALLNHFHLKG
ncbi:MAG: bifunctional hydroxymethylpyrimidine kinase/phosphomethylpyrimidine kinase [Syntrophomonas sp.]